MKTQSLTLLTIGLCSFAIFTSAADARPRWKRAKHQANKIENKAEKRAAKEEAAVAKKDFKEETTQGDDATPLLNKKQKKLEKRIAAGVKSGKLSTGEASSLRRKLNSLARYEATLKAGELSTSERERLHKKSLEVTRAINKELKD